MWRSGRLIERPRPWIRDGRRHRRGLAEIDLPPSRSNAVHDPSRSSIEVVESPVPTRRELELERQTAGWRREGRTISTSGMCPPRIRAQYLRIAGEAPHRPQRCHWPSASSAEITGKQQLTEPTCVWWCPSPSGTNRRDELPRSHPRATWVSTARGEFDYPRAQVLHIRDLVDPRRHPGHRRQGRTIRSPVHMVEKINKLIRVQRQLLQNMAASLPEGSPPRWA